MLGARAIFGPAKIMTKITLVTDKTMSMEQLSLTVIYYPRANLILHLLNFSQEQIAFTRQVCILRCIKIVFVRNIYKRFLEENINI